MALTLFDLDEFPEFTKCLDNNLCASETRIEYVTKVAKKHLPEVTKSCHSEAIFRYKMKNILGLREEFYVIYLNRANRVLACNKHSSGSLYATLVDVKLIALDAIKLLAFGVVLCHNHPSGSLKPSPQDIKITQTVKEGLKLIDVLLYDHIIITEESYYSFADDGNL